METYTFEEKTLDLAKNKALQELGTTEENIIVKKITEKNSLLKKSVTIEVITYNQVINYVKETLKEILKLMNIDANIEIKRRDNKIDINIFSDNNAILIGKNGRTMKALQNILKQMVSTKIAEDIYITLDVSDYKEKRNRRICSLAKRIAREVAKTKIETSLDNMNSYERRLVHSTLADNKYVYTVSVGEEPLRHVVIKPKEE